MRMLALVATAALLAGCGDDGGDTTASGREILEVAVVSGPDTGPPVEEDAATELSGAREIRSYAAAFPAGVRRDLVRTAAGLSPGPGERLYAQRVHVGCTAPPADSVSVEHTSAGVALRAAHKDDPKITCVVAHQSVALVLVRETSQGG